MNSCVSRLSIRAAALGAVVLLTCGAEVTAQNADAIAFQIPGRDLRTDPPKVLALDVQPSAAHPGLGLLSVRFAEKVLPPVLTILYKGGPKTLRDDGQGEDGAQDGTYSALLDLDAQTPFSFQAASAPLDAEKTLFIRDPSVVDNPARTSDPCLSTSASDASKKWSFGYLITQMANEQQTGRSPHDLALSLLRQWEGPAFLNGDPISARPRIRELVTEKWLRASGNTGRLAMHKAPFRLLGIVNRLDLRQNLFFGEGLAGELRFVWGVLDLENRAGDGSCQEIPNFTLIMEYAVDKANVDEVKAWGQKWAGLNALAIDSPAFRTGLQQITESVVRARVGARKNRANGSALIRIRTNEIALDSPWELREFNIAKRNELAPGLFFGVTVKQNPASRHNGSDLFASFVNENEAQILAGRHNVPLMFHDIHFLGARSPNVIDSWNGPGIRNNEARHQVSLNTCNGCHGGETSTGFLHVFPRPRSARAFLSGFMTGEQVTDPVDPGTVRQMNDLERRARDLEQLTSGAPLAQLSFEPTNRVH
jgi:hypothetical protein